MSNLFVFMTPDKTSVIKVPDNSLNLFPALAFKIEVLTPKGFSVIVQVFAGNVALSNNVAAVPLVQFMNDPLVRCEKAVDIAEHTWFLCAITHKGRDVFSVHESFDTARLDYDQALNDPLTSSASIWSKCVESTEPHYIS